MQPKMASGRQSLFIKNTSKKQNEEDCPVMLKIIHLQIPKVIIFQDGIMINYADTQQEVGSGKLVLNINLM